VAFESRSLRARGDITGVTVAPSHHAGQPETAAEHTYRRAGLLGVEFALGPLVSVCPSLLLPSAVALATTRPLNTPSVPPVRQQQYCSEPKTRFVPNAELRSTTPQFPPVFNLNFRITAVTLEQHFGSARQTASQRHGNACPVNYGRASDAGRQPRSPDDRCPLAHWSRALGRWSITCCPPTP
jgi:hypothetical protein